MPDLSAVERVDETLGSGSPVTARWIGDVDGAGEWMGGSRWVVLGYLIDYAYEENQRAR
jgi:hypothetical protein